ncbi:universal stress protein [Halomarina ordinaria]|uniref:Universal stress protein n=1 Tax=Halomarina ordinaria TaxID=3033939 RepID=A0ABD5U3T1_9EURY|nr:universal stress protein [Halomarina sp. PSRA2]
MTSLLDHVLVPVANEDDARETARALAPYDPDSVTVVHVVEKGEGVPDKTPVEQSEQLAADAYAAFRETFPDANTETRYARDVVEEVFAAAADLDASVVAFRPREDGLLARLFSGDRTRKLVTEGDRPVVALPSREADDA